MKIDHKPGSELMAVTGANGRQILLDREERGTLLKHLLNSLGVPEWPGYPVDAPGFTEANDWHSILRGLSRQLKESDAKNKLLQEENERLENVKDDLIEMAHNRGEPVEDLEFVIELRNENTRLQSELDSTRAKLEEADKAVTWLQDKNRKQASQLEDARKMYLDLNKALKVENADLKADVEGLAVELHETRENLKATRQARLSELLEAEARERVEVVDKRDGDTGTVQFWVDGLSITRLTVSLEQKSNDYHTALTRILKWAHKAFDNECAFVDGNELFDALSDAGFEIDSDDCLVIGQMGAAD